MKITSLILTFTLLCGATTAMSQEPVQVMPQQEQQTTDVSDKELGQFAEVYMEIQAENEKFQGEAMGLIEKEGMEVDRFNELANAQNNPDQEIDADEKEMEKLAVIGTKIQEIQTDFQSRVMTMIEKGGLSMDRYQEVFLAVQQDPVLQQKLGALING